MPAGVVALAMVGPLAVAGAWLLIRRARVSLWVVNGVVLPVLGAASLLTGAVEPSRLRVGTGWAAFLGVVAGLGLYAATAAFMAVAGRWPPLARHTASLYENRSGMSLPLAVGLSAFLIAPGEELLWRGVVLESARVWIGSAELAGAVVWAAYVAANAVSLSVPIVLGAVVGGAAWTALAVLTGGVVASIACHAVWTALMVAFPPVPRSR